MQLNTVNATASNLPQSETLVCEEQESAHPVAKGLQSKTQCVSKDHDKERSEEDQKV